MVALNTRQIVENHIGEPISSNLMVGGGCISNASIIKTESGKSYFLKSLESSGDMFSKEANGLHEIAKSETLKVPIVILAGHNFLLLESIQDAPRTNEFFSNFGKELAQMHRFTHSDYGFYEDNYIGSSLQCNQASVDEKEDWSAFYFNKRLLPQLKMAQQHAYATPELRKGIMQLESKLPKILSGSSAKPSLLHGDLWSGNFMCNHKGDAILIDPAVYYGDREADLAMTRMFGGFTAEFYSSYQAEFPLPDGWEYRQNIYLLYHYLNHLNLFGNSYYKQCMDLILFYL